MKKKARVIVCLLISVALMLLCGCSKKMNYVLDSSEWREWKIGTPLAWSADYYLSTSNEVKKLYRYDAMSDCILAMRHGYIDAVAVDKIFAQYVTTIHPEVKILEDVRVGPDGVLAFIAKDRTDIQKEMNEFIEVFCQSEQYEDLQYRVANYQDNQFISNNMIGENENGKKLIVATMSTSGNYPYTFYDFNTGEPQGVDIEIVKQFAYEYGYTIEWVDGVWESNVMALNAQKVDILVGACSAYYANEVEVSGNFIVSEPYFDLELCLLVMNEKVRDIDDANNKPPAFLP